jgi:hypothetical protein
LLDEQMMAGALAMHAWVMHQNRDCYPEAGVEADFWFKYLDQNWVPKWLTRTTHGAKKQYTPPASLGLKTAKTWNGPGTDRPIQKWGNGHNSQYNIGSGKHQYPVRDLAHPYIMSIVMYYTMGEYFKETGKPVLGSWNKRYQDYVEEAKVRE